MLISKANAEHYVWGGDCDGWHLVKAADGGLSVIHERMPPGSTEKRHTHQRARQFFFVLAGTLTMEIEGREETIPAGHGLEIAPLSPHQAMNRSQADVEFLVISQPTIRGDRRDLDG